MSPISVILDTTEVIKTLREIVVPWRRSHAARLAELDILQKQRELAQSEIEIVEILSSSQVIDQVVQQPASIRAKSILASRGGRAILSVGILITIGIYLTLIYSVVSINYSNIAGYLTFLTIVILCAYLIYSLFSGLFKSKSKTNNKTMMKHGAESLQEVQELESEVERLRQQAAQELIRTRLENQQRRLEIEKRRLELKESQLDLHQAKMELALSLIEKFAPNISETERAVYITQLLKPLDVLIQTPLEIKSSLSSE